MKAWVLSVVIAVFGFGQVACACAALPAQVTSHVQASHTDHHAHNMHAIAGEGHHAALTEPVPDDEDCCQSSAWATSGASFGLTVAPLNTASNIALLPQPLAQVGFSGATPASSFPRSWLDPPNRTPVALKVKSLN